MLNFITHCPAAEEYSLSSVSALFISLVLNTAKFSIPFDCVKCKPQSWWSPVVEEAVIERYMAFAAAPRSDKDCQIYFSASRPASCFIANAKAEAW